MRYKIATQIFTTAVEGFAVDAPIAPDVGVTITIDDLIAGEDPVLMQALGSF
ncbi:MAG: hypothetical protein AAFX85_11440 [Pseudomonadota bacterium]